jgi:hypothetical protein
MTESTQDQISAFIDGELSADETEFLLRRLGHDSGARRHLRSYLAIGAAVRGDLIADRAVDLSGSVAQALDGTEDEVHGHGEARGWLRFVKPVIGVAIAASVAVSALLVLQDPGTPEASVATVDSPPPNSEAPTYVVPNGQDPIPALVRPQIRLTNYLFSHGQYASSLGRQRINSSVLADQQAGSEVVPEMDDDNSE